MPAWQRRVNPPSGKKCLTARHFVRGSCPANADVRCSSLAATQQLVDEDPRRSDCRGSLGRVIKVG